MALFGISSEKWFDAAQSAASPLLGQVYNAIFHKQQVKHQQDFQDQAIAGNKAMGQFNQQQAMEMWRDTNYPAQMEQLKKAGLNPGLMYGSAGQGGQTQGGQGGNMAQGTAPNAKDMAGMGLQMMEQIKLLRAQKENIEADTANKKAELPVKGAEVPLKGAQTANYQTDTQLKQSQIKLNEFNTQIAKIESEVKTEGKSLQMGTLDAIWKKLQADTKLTEAQTDEARAKIVNLGIQGALMKSDIAKNQSDIDVNTAKIEEIVNAIEQKWRGLEIQGIAVGSTEIASAASTLRTAGLSDEGAQELLNLIVGIVGVGNMIKGKTTVKTKANVKH